MPLPYLGEIRIVPFTFAPRGWALCNGQLLPINQNQALYSLFGTMYGGDGQFNFALPDLQGRAPVHWDGSGYPGEMGGSSSHILRTFELPEHTHDVRASEAPRQHDYPTTWWAAHEAAPYTLAGTNQSGNVAFHPETITRTGGELAHSNMQPYLTLNFIVALEGLFPSRN